MSLDQLDPDLLLDFVTESNELIESVDQDLVRLESVPNDLELLNNVFRALHTIKGSAGFLALDPLTEVTHAAEDALNCLRKGEIALTSDTMTLLLKAVDVIREQISDIEGGQMCRAGDPATVAGLCAIGSEASAPRDGDSVPVGSQPANSREQAATPPSTPTDTAAAEMAGPIAVVGDSVAAPTDAGVKDADRIELDPAKQTLVPFMADDLAKSLQEMSEVFHGACSGDDRASSGAQIASIAEELHRAVSFFGVEEITAEVGLFQTLGEKLTKTSNETVPNLAPRIDALILILHERAAGLRQNQRVHFDTGTLIERISTLLDGGTLPPESCLSEESDFSDVQRIDRLTSDSPTTDTTQAPSPTLIPDTRGGGNTTVDREAKRLHRVDPTIRVDVSRLESLLNLIGELVLQKNRVLSVARRLSEGTEIETVQDIGQVASDLDRVTGELQLGVMKTRLQPLNKVFSRFPRVIRDLAQSTGKQIELDILGGDTEVDKSVIEAIGDPLVHILRNSADHAIETPDDRITSGKSGTGRIRLSAEHQGNHVLIQIRDDGRGIDPDKIGRLAVERGLVGAEELTTMSRNAILRLIFAPGFTTAKTLSNISGRGVGMDVVRTNIQKLNGTVDIESETGVGTTVSMRIPLTVAIMPAMMVLVGDETYAIPLSSIREIVRISTATLVTVNGQPVLRNRELVLPVIDLHEAFKGRRAEQAPFAVVVAVADQKYALLVQGLVGQQEVVIKPLDDLLEGEESSFLSGATVREDGGVSLIVDVATLTKWASRSLVSAA